MLKGAEVMAGAPAPLRRLSTVMGMCKVCKVFFMYFHVLTNMKRAILSVGLVISMVALVGSSYKLSNHSKLYNGQNDEMKYTMQKLVAMVVVSGIGICLFSTLLVIDMYTTGFATTTTTKKMRAFMENNLGALTPQNNPGALIPFFKEQGWSPKLRTVSPIWRDVYDEYMERNPDERRMSKWLLTKKELNNARASSKVFKLRVMGFVPTDLSDIFALDLTNKKISDVSMLGSVHELNLAGCRRVVDVSMLGGVYSLNLTGTGVTDVSMLGGVHTLILSHNKVSDVSMLGNVHTLNLAGCVDVTDISALGNVHELNLAGCRRVVDVSILRGVYSLNLTGTGVTDVSMLGNVHELGLSNTEVADVSMLGKVHALDLSYCNQVSDVSMLGSVHTLYLSGCGRVTDFSALGKVHELHLANIDITDVSAFGGVYTLNLADCHGVTDVSALGGVYKLNLYNCTGVTDVSALGKVHTLTLAHCHGVTDVSALGGVHTLNLMDCVGVTDLSALDGVACLIPPSGQRRGC
jgi:hypothetical protein